jgi:hypothetical protein
VAAPVDRWAARVIQHKKKVIRLGDEMAMKKREAKENRYGDQV